MVSAQETDAFLIQINHQVLIRLRPCLSIEIPRFEDTFVQKDQVAVVLLDIVELIIKLDSIMIELTDPLFFPCRDARNLYLLSLESSKLHYF